MNLRIASSYANLRVTPNTSKAPLARLPAGHPVTALADPDGDWQKCKASIDGDDLEGFIHKSLLRPEINPEVDRLVELTGVEYKRFEFGERHETHPASRARIKAYWLSFARSAMPVSEPWSAAFISFLVKQSALRKSFKFSGRHTDYLSDSKKAKVAGDSSCAYWAVQINERILQVGDLIGAYRTGDNCGSARKTYDSLPGDFCAHCDLVVAIRNGKAVVIGGNVGNTVKQKDIPLDASGRVSEGGKRIVVMARNF